MDTALASEEGSTSLRLAPKLKVSSGGGGSPLITLGMPEGLEPSVMEVRFRSVDLSFPGGSGGFATSAISLLFFLFFFKDRNHPLHGQAFKGMCKANESTQVDQTTIEVERKAKIADAPEFYWDELTEEPHATRRKLIVAAHPEIKSLFGHCPLTKWKVLASVLIQLISIHLLQDASWQTWLFCCYTLSGAINHMMTVSRGASFTRGATREVKRFVKGRRVVQRHCILSPVPDRRFA